MWGSAGFRKEGISRFLFCEHNSLLATEAKMGSERPCEKAFLRDTLCILEKAVWCRLWHR